MGRKDVVLWAGANDTLPILMLEMAQPCTLVEFQFKELEREEFCYVREFCGSYRRVITSLAKNGLTRGLTLKEMVKTSLLAAKAYSRSSTDCAAQRDHIYKRMSVDMWVSLGPRLVICMGKIAEQSKNCTSTDQMKDFTFTEWTNLEQQGETAFVLDEVAIAQDLQSADEMRGAREALIDIAQETEDRLELLRRIKEQILIHTQEMKLWKRENEAKEWYLMQNYKGLSWDNEDRDDGWPAWEYHQYQTIQSGLTSEQSTYDWEFHIVQRGSSVPGPRTSSHKVAAHLP